MHVEKHVQTAQDYKHILCAKHKIKHKLQLRYIKMNDKWKLFSSVIACYLPSSILGHRESDPEAWLIHFFADFFHIQDWFYTVWAILHATLRSWTKTAVVQACVTFVVAALLQSDSRGYPWNTNMDHELFTENRTDQLFDFCNISWEA